MDPFDLMTRLEMRLFIESGGVLPPAAARRYASGKPDQVLWHQPPKIVNKVRGTRRHPNLRHPNLQSLASEAA